MQNVQNATDQNIRFLITANYQRMMSYEQAAFLTSEQAFKEFYTARADESENNIQQLYLLLNISHAAEDQQTAPAELSFAHLFHGKKTTSKILECVKTIEKTIVTWYQATLKEIKDLPKEIVALVEEQYSRLTYAKLTLEHL
jgi:hypothetical protein